MCSLRVLNIVLIFISGFNLYNSIQILNIEYVKEDDWGVVYYRVQVSNGSEDEPVSTLRKSFSNNVIQFYNSTLSEIPENVFEIFPNLTAVFFDNCELEHLKETDFPENLELRELYLPKNKIQELPANVFVRLVKLSILELSHNSLTQLKAHDFNGLSDLTELYINNNKIQELSVDTFQPLVNLEILNLVSNEIEVIPEGLFSTNHNLTRIFLSSNKIRELGANTFYLLDNLKILEIRDGSFEYLYLSSLNALNVGDSKLKQIFIAGSINNLNVENSQLENLLIGDLLSLSVVDAKNNKISNITNIKGAVNMTILNLSGNPLGNLPADVFDEMVNLNVLELSNTNVTHFENNTIFKNLDSINQLYLIGNNLTTLDKDLFVLRKPHGFHVYLNSDVCSRIDLESFRSSNARIVCSA